MILKLTGTVTPVLGIVRSLSVVISNPVHHAFRVVAVLPQFGPTFVIVWRRTSPESSGSVTPRTHGAHASRATATCLNEGNMVKGKDKGWVLEKKFAKECSKKLDPTSQKAWLLMSNATSWDTVLFLYTKCSRHEAPHVID